MPEQNLFQFYRDNAMDKLSYSDRNKCFCDLNQYEVHALLLHIKAMRETLDENQDVILANIKKKMDEMNTPSKN